MMRTTVVLPAWMLLAVAVHWLSGAMAVDAAPRSARPLEVSDFMRHVDRHRGMVTVRGVVSGASPALRVITLIDVAEFDACRTVTCAPLYLPVRWTGPMPRVRSTVEVRGQVQKVGGKLVFAADSLRTVAGAKP